MAALIIGASLVLGTMMVKHSENEVAPENFFDKFALFLGRVTMLLVVSLVTAMLVEVVLRYVFEAPTVWANELCLWMSGFVFLLSGLYAMQQRNHIRIYLLYDILPRNASPTLNKKTNPKIPKAIEKPFFLKKLVIGPLIVPPIHDIN